MRRSRSHLSPAQHRTQGRCGPPASYLAQGRPDPCLTPGDTDPAVTQATIRQTICVPGYARRHRPPYSSPTGSRWRSPAPTASTPFDPRAYEGDHLIPISLGGNPEADGSTRNFWDQPRRGAASAADKDGLELFLYRQVCAGRISLAAAQQAFVSDWVAAWVRYGRPRADGRRVRHKPAADHGPGKRLRTDAATKLRGQRPPQHVTWIRPITAPAASFQTRIASGVGSSSTQQLFRLK